MTRYLIYGLLGTPFIVVMTIFVIALIDQQGVNSGAYDPIIWGSAVAGLVLCLFAAHASNAKGPDSSIFDNQTVGPYILWGPVGAYIGLLIAHHFDPKDIHPLVFGAIMLVCGFVGVQLMKTWLRSKGVN